MHLPLALFLAAVPPVIPLPPELEVCILQAEVCALEAGSPSCGDPDAFQDCLAEWESCSYRFAGAHVPNCRVALAWCRVEHCTSTDQGLKACQEIYETCPDPLLADTCPAPG